MTQQRGWAVDRPPRQRAARSGGPARGNGKGADLARLRAIVVRCVEESGYDLDNLAVKRVGQRHLVRILVDGDLGIDLDRVAELSRKISGTLDAAEAEGKEIISGEYDLEVGSPGVDRPLVEPRHWRRNVGRLVQVRAGRRQVTGRVVATDDAGVRLDIDAVVERFDFAELGEGRVQVELTRAAGDNDSDELDDDEIDADSAEVEINDEREDEE